MADWSDTSIAAIKQGLRESGHFNTLEYIEDLEAEIRRHHTDFERWEEMAAAGAGKAAENDKLRDFIAQWIERLSPEDAEKLGAAVQALQELFAPLGPQYLDTLRPEL